MTPEEQQRQARFAHYTNVIKALKKAEPTIRATVRSLGIPGATEEMWRAEHEHYKHIEPNYYRWKAFMLAERDGRGAGDDMGSAIAKSILTALGVAMLIAIGMGLLLFALLR